MRSKVAVPKDTKKLLKNLIIASTTLVLVIVISGVILGNAADMNLSEGILYAAGSLSHSDLSTESNISVIFTIVFLGFFGTVLSFYVFWLFIDYFLTGKFNEHLLGVQNMVKLKSMKGHVIICGGGRVGEHLAEKLVKEGKGVVILENNDTRVGELKQMGIQVFNADALNEESLKDAGIEKASFVAAVLGEDSDNLLLILTAKELNPGVKVASRASDEKIVPKLEHAGADMVILPEVLGGIKLAEAMLGNVDACHIIDLLKEEVEHKNHPDHGRS